ncbi:hypothetical protein [Streptacidiphilus cavernicola]|uniref:Uncharacterized protein n=1 Tax=Streptacidiphilus cavernicola TaxID=3342716 RepID=A0ABV6VYA3_9ACTN
MSAPDDFREWVCRFVGCEDQVGALAREIAADDHWPYGVPESLERYRARLVELDCDQEVRETLEAVWSQYPGSEPLLRYFEAGHLPAHLREVSLMVGEVARRAVRLLPPGEQRRLGVQRLLDAKDALVRAAL